MFTAPFFRYAFIITLFSRFFKPFAGKFEEKRDIFLLIERKNPSPLYRFYIFCNVYINNRNIHYFFL